MKIKLRACALILLFIASAKAQQPATPGENLAKAVENKEELTKNSLVKNVPFTTIGPTIMSGRVVDVDVNPENSTEFYVGYATGGVWHTDNNGVTFTSVFDSAPTQSVGDIAVDWKKGTLWAGTGETISSRSSYAGVGILKSTDNGKTWIVMGLVDGHHISDIIIDPSDPQVVTVAVLGHLYSDNEERGVYKTLDGGKTWKKTLYINDHTGVISLVAAPNNPQVMYAAAWDRERKAWDFRGSGKSSGIYKSTDGGDSWTLITTGNGFPQGDGVGRIGLAAIDEHTVYAVHDNQFRRPKEAKKPDEKETDKLKSEDFEKMNKKTFLALDDEKLGDYLKSNRFPRQYAADTVKTLVREDKFKPSDFYLFTNDKNAVEHDTEVIGAEVYLTKDGGMTWKRTHEGYIDDLFYSYGYVFSEISVNPQNPDELYLVGVPIVKSEDGGKTFSYINEPNLHVDHHVLWIDPKMPQHLINGNDGGLNISFDGGKSWTKNNSLPVSQFFAIAVDYEKPYNVYGGMQDNGTWKGPHTYEYSTDYEANGKYPYENIAGGDGMQLQVDRRDANIVYAGSQFGFYNRIDLKTGKRTFIKPSHSLGEARYRFNWQTPILLSPHNQDILYMGGNKLMRSFDRGDNWEAISPDLTTGGKKGSVPFGTLTTISESPFQFGLIYTGSDDGLIQVTRDGGGNWEEISNNLPKDLWVSHVVASKYKKSRVYATLNGYRWDDFKPYVYSSVDFGKTWKDISSNLPLSPINVIIEDPKNQNMLYVGTDNGLYVSFDAGANWQAFDGGLPEVPVHDLIIQTEAHDLVVGTHGRSLYITNLSALQEWDANAKKLQLFTIKPIKYNPNWGKSWSKWSKISTPETKIVFFAPKNGEAGINILSEDKKVLKTWTASVDKGFDYVDYDLSISEEGKESLEKAKKDFKIDKADNDTYYLPAGDYTVEVTLDGTKETTELKVEALKNGESKSEMPRSEFEMEEGE